jgi:hypothetical protein
MRAGCIMCLRQLRQVISILILPTAKGKSLALERPNLGTWSKGQAASKGKAASVSYAVRTVVLTGLCDPLSLGPSIWNPASRTCREASPGHGNRPAVPR